MQLCCCLRLTAFVLRSVCRQQCTESCLAQSSNPCPHLLEVVSAPSVAVVVFCLKSTSLVWPSVASSAEDRLEDGTAVLTGLVAVQFEAFAHQPMSYLCLHLATSHNLAASTLLPHERNRHGCSSSR